MHLGKYFPFLSTAEDSGEPNPHIDTYSKYKKNIGWIKLWFYQKKKINVSSVRQNILSWNIALIYISYVLNKTKQDIPFIWRENPTQHFAFASSG